MEEESAGVLPFLDVSVTRSGATLSCSIYRKPTFSGLGTSYFSNIFEKFKLCSVRTLIHRAYYLCSSYALFHREILFLSGYFRNNGFPTHVIDTHVRRFFNKIHSPKPSPCSVPLFQRPPVWCYLQIFVWWLWRHLHWLHQATVQG